MAAILGLGGLAKAASPPQSKYRILVKNVKISHHEGQEGRWRVDFDVIEPGGKSSDWGLWANRKFDPAEFPMLRDGEIDPDAPVVSLTSISDHFIFDTDKVCLRYTVKGTDGVTNDRHVFFDRGTQETVELDLS